MASRIHLKINFEHAGLKWARAGRTDRMPALPGCTCRLQVLAAGGEQPLPCLHRLAAQVVVELVGVGESAPASGDRVPPATGAVVHGVSTAHASAVPTDAVGVRFCCGIRSVDAIGVDVLQVQRCGDVLDTLVGVDSGQRDGCRAEEPSEARQHQEADGSPSETAAGASRGDVGHMSDASFLWLCSGKTEQVIPTTDRQPGNKGASTGLFNPTCSSAKTGPYKPETL